MSPSDLPYSPASERNREPIAAVLERWLPDSARVLEIGGGTGQHAVYFARRMPSVVWQTSDLADSLPGLTARLEREAPDLPRPLNLDVTGDWPDGRFDAVFTANTLHIMPWDHTPVLISRAGERLPPGGFLIIYGPFHYGGRHTSASNRDFDASLRARDAAMGLRDAREVTRLAVASDLAAEADIAMPANNRLLIYRKAGTG